MGKDTKETILRQTESQRDAFFTELGKQMETDEDIVIIVADMSTPVFDEIRKKFPHRFINVGIAEQNAVSIASGLALKGKKVFVYAIASFMITRCFEQIRINCSIMNLPITIVGVGAGFSYDDSGPTHHLFEDIALIRSLPNMTIYNISDTEIATYIATKCVSDPAPRYVRLDRHISSPLTRDIESKEPNGWRMVRDSVSNRAILSTGNMVRTAMMAAAETNCTVIDVFKIPCNIEELLIQLADRDITSIFTLEESFAPGGFGSYILEEMNTHCDETSQMFLTRISMEHKWIYNYGGREANQKSHGIDVESVIKRIQQSE